jgi:hypothetical protein
MKAGEASEKSSFASAVANPNRESSLNEGLGFSRSSARGSASRSLDKGRVPHISLVFREMWDSTDVDR